MGPPLCKRFLSVKLGDILAQCEDYGYHSIDWSFLVVSWLSGVSRYQGPRFLGWGGPLSLITRVVITDKLVRDFRKAAIAAMPNECLWSVWGRIQGDTVIVERLAQPHQKVSETDVSINRDVMLAPAVGQHQYIGTIHSHPESSDASPSTTDWTDAYATGEHVFGVMRVYKSNKGTWKTELDWWEPRASIQMIYPKVRTTNEKKRKRTGQSQPVSEVRLQETGNPELRHDVA